SGPTVDAIALEIARNSFFDGLAETTRLLQAASEGALAATRAERIALVEEVTRFGADFNGYEFAPYPVGIKGHPRGREQTVAHGHAVHRLNRHLTRSPALTRLAL